MEDNIKRIDPNFRVVGWQGQEDKHQRFQTKINDISDNNIFKAVIVRRNQDLEEDSVISKRNKPRQPKVKREVMSAYRVNFLPDDITQDAGCAQLIWEQPNEKGSGKGLFRMMYNDSKLKYVQKM